MRYPRLLTTVVVISFIFIGCQKNNDPDPQPTPKPLGTFSITVSNRQSTTVDVSWTASTNPYNSSVVKYKVLINSNEVANNLTGTSFSVTGLVAGNSYAGRIMAFTADGDT